MDLVHKKNSWYNPEYITKKAKLGMGILQKIIGIGCDLADIKRIRESIKAHPDLFIKRIYTESEIAYCEKFKDPCPHYAARFAAKEAVSKALSVGIGKKLSWQDIQIVSGPTQKPYVELVIHPQSEFNGIFFELSLSHEKEMALAFVIAYRIA